MTESDRRRELHDLRNKLNSIVSAAFLLQEHIRTPDGEGLRLRIQERVREAAKIVDSIEAVLLPPPAANDA